MNETQILKMLDTIDKMEKSNVSLRITRLQRPYEEDDGTEVDWSNYFFLSPDYSATQDPDYLAGVLFDLSLKYSIVSIDFQVTCNAWAETSAGQIPVSKYVVLELEVVKSYNGETNITGDVVEAILKLYK